MQLNRLCVMGILGAVVAACSSNSASPGGDGGVAVEQDATGSEEAAAPVPDSGGAMDAGAVTVIGKVVDGSMLTAAKNFDATQYAAVSGVQVCVYGQSAVPCATTDASGSYTLDVPAGAAFTLSYEKSGYASILYAQAAMTPGTSAALAAILLSSTSSFDSFQTMAGATPDPTKGVILFGGGTVGTAAPGSLYHEMFGPYNYYYASGYSVAVSPAATVGPVYVSAQWQPDPSLTASSTAGWGYVQAPPGTYTVTYSSPTLSCGSTMATVVAGFITTYVGVACTIASTDASTPDASTSDASMPDASTDGG